MISTQDLVCLFIVIMPKVLSLCEFEKCTYLEIPTWLQVASEVLGYTVMLSTFMLKTVLSLIQQPGAFKRSSPVLLCIVPVLLLQGSIPSFLPRPKSGKVSYILIEKRLKT